MTRSSTIWQGAIAGSVAAVFHVTRGIPVKYEAQQQRAVYVSPFAVGCSTAAEVYPFMPVANIFRRTGLQDDDLREALAKHAECWTGDSIDPSIATAEVCRRVTMGSEAAACC